MEYKIIVNSNTELVNKIRKKLKENDGYCPCSIEKSENTKCPCKYFLERNESGECHCGLYVKEIIK